MEWWGWECSQCGWRTFDLDVLRREVHHPSGPGSTLICPGCGKRGRQFRDAKLPGLDLTGIDWLIAGGESGGRTGRALVERVDGAWRPKNAAVEWVRELRDACEPATAFYFKQWGGPRPAAGGRELDGCTWDELPAEAVALGQRQA